MSDARREAMAKALWAADPELVEERAYDPTWDGLAPAARESYLALADAALAQVAPEIDRLRDSYDAAIRDASIRLQADTLTVQSLKAEIARLTRERDEAREQASAERQLRHVHAGCHESAEQECDRLTARLAEVEGALNIERFRAYHDSSFLDLPSYHEADAPELWACDMCLERYIDQVKALLAPPPTAGEAEKAPFHCAEYAGCSETHCCYPGEEDCAMGMMEG